MSQIAFIAYENCLASSISLPLEMLNAAADAFASQQLGRNRIPRATATLFGKTRSVRCAGGLQLRTEAHPSEIESPELILFPAIWRNSVSVISQNRYLLALVRKWDQQKIKLCAVGTSASFFAESGILDKRPATTHWAHFEAFQKRYPTVQLQRDFLITRSQNLYCASSVNSVADLILYFIAEIYNEDIAKRVEANFSPEVRQSYATSMYTEGDHSQHPDEDIVRLQHWLNENYSNKLATGQMAEMLGVSVRTLNRRFKQATQRSPTEYLQQTRIAHAKILLKNTNLGVGDIAEQTGHNDTSYFCSQFKKLTSVSAVEYRKAVKSKLFSVQ